MKQLLSLLVLTACFSACNNPASTATGSSGKDCTRVATSTAPNSGIDSTRVFTVPPNTLYQIQYKKWEFGDAGRVKMVVDMYKNFDDSKIDLVADACADTLRMEWPNGHHTMTAKPHIPDSLKKWRTQIGASSTNILVAIPLHNPDRNEDWVCIWCVNHWTDMKGKADSSLSNDNWMLKNGKLAYMTSLEQKLLPRK